MRARYAATCKHPLTVPCLKRGFTVRYSWICGNRDVRITAPRFPPRLWPSADDFSARSFSLLCARDPTPFQEIVILTFTITGHCQILSSQSLISANWKQISLLLRHQKRFIFFLYLLQFASNNIIYIYSYS